MQIYALIHSYPIIKAIIITAEKQGIIYVVHITAEKQGIIYVVHITAEKQGIIYVVHITAEKPPARVAFVVRAVNKYGTY